MLQIKDAPESDIMPQQEKLKRVKISTLKIDDSLRSQRLSEAIISIIFNEMNFNSITQAYITLFKEKQKTLHKILLSWGFVETGKKGGELVMTKCSNKVMQTVKENYKWYFNEPISELYKKSNFYLIPLESEYHDKLLPTNKLTNVPNKAKEFNISSISISKTYICKIGYETLPRNGDFLLEYRISDSKPKNFKSVVTGVGIIDEVYDGRKNIDFEKWLGLVGNTSVFNKNELKIQYDQGRRIIIKYFHIFSFGEGKNINYQQLQDSGIWPKDVYQPAFPIKNKEQVYYWILERLDQYENFNGSS